jgi:hypothetical protein
MKKTFVSLLALGSLAAEPLFAQTPSAVNSLARARATFAAADANKDGRIGFDEYQKNKLGERREFDGQDPDKDGALSLDEFTLFYRQMLVRAGERPAADLEQEVTRVHAVRKARAVDEATRKAAAQRDAAKPAEQVKPDAAGQVAPKSQPVKPSAAELDLDARLEIALDALEKKAEARNASREDFNQVRDMYIARAEAAKATAGTPGGAGEVDIVARFGRVLDELEKKAMAGEYSREEYQALRQSYIKRARGAVAEKPTPEAQPDPLEARFEAALADLEQRALARNASREDFNRVREMLIARARLAAGGTAGDTTPNTQFDELKQKLEAALTQLENRANEGNVTREEFQALRNMLIKRARNAAHDAQQPSGPGAARARAAETQKVPAPVQGPGEARSKDAPAPAPKPSEPSRETKPVKPPETPPVSTPGQTPPKDEKPGTGRPASKPPQARG